MDLDSVSFFTAGPDDPGSPDDAEVLVPTDLARSTWSSGQLHGVAVSGALARAAERAVDALGRDDLRPARHSVDLFRPADGASLVTNWGTEGVQQINTDITLAIARLPVGTEVGLVALDRVESDGIAVGTAAVFDREGPVGEVVMTSIANVRGRSTSPRSSTTTTAPGGRDTPRLGLGTLGG